MNKTSKKIMALVAVVALVAVLGICLVACNSDSVGKSLEKKGYTVTKLNEESTGIVAKAVYKALKNNSAFTEGVVANKSTDFVIVIWFDNSDAAKDYADTASYVGAKVEISGKIVYVGTEQGLKDAK